MDFQWTLKIISQLNLLNRSVNLSVTTLEARITILSDSSYFVFSVNNPIWHMEYFGYTKLCLLKTLGYIFKTLISILEISHKDWACLRQLQCLNKCDYWNVVSWKKKFFHSEQSNVATIINSLPVTTGLLSLKSFHCCCHFESLCKTTSWVCL